MGTITCQSIADKAWTKVNEATGGSAVRWPTAEAFGWICDGQREIVNQLPRSYAVRSTPTVVAGTRQTLAGLGLTTAIQVLDVVANYNAAGTVRVRAITKRNRAEIDDQVPTWHSATASEAVHWYFDDQDPKAFYIYPAILSAAGKLEIITSDSPADPASIAAAITLDDIYANALQFFVLFSFYSKDATYTKSPQAAATYSSLVQGSRGIRGQNIAGSDKAGDMKALGA